MSVQMGERAAERRKNHRFPSRLESFIKIRQPKTRFCRNTQTRKNLDGATEDEIFYELKIK